MREKYLNRFYLSIFLAPSVLVMSSLYSIFFSDLISIEFIIIQRVLFVVVSCVFMISSYKVSKYLYFELLPTFIAITFFSMIIQPMFIFFTLDYYVPNIFNYLIIHTLLILVYFYDRRK